jgi:hypothetical protein
MFFLTERGIHSIEQLRAIARELPPNIQVGLKYYDDLLKRIPRQVHLTSDNMICQFSICVPSISSVSLVVAVVVIIAFTMTILIAGSD